MKKLILIAAIVFPLFALGQKNTNYLKVAGQVAIPLGNLSDIVNTGFGGSVKGIFGFSKLPQYFTVEAGYNRFGIKNAPIGSSSSFSGNYAAIPIYGGYRARMDKLVFDAQAGVSFNRIAASSNGGSASDSQTAFGWAFGASYDFKGAEIGLRYQSSEASNDTFIIRFLGIRLGYNFSL